MKKLIFTIFFCFLVPTFGYATDFVVEVDTGGETVNAIEGLVFIPENLMIDNVYTGNSSILFWIVSPKYSKESGITFAGFTPGGFKGVQSLFSFSGEFSNKELASILPDKIVALRNDGLGTTVPVKVRIARSEIKEDMSPPEPFEIIVSSSPDVFSNRYFLSFATQDKGTGVRRYEYSSVWLVPLWNTWHEAELPLMLTREMLFKRVYVRALDGAGNYRTQSVAGPYRYATIVISTIILLCVLYLSRRFVR